jgi:hypothetical protein
MARSDAERRAVSFIHRLWPPLMIIAGLGLTAAWIMLIAYGLLLLLGLPL